MDRFYTEGEEIQKYSYAIETDNIFHYFSSSLFNALQKHIAKNENKNENKNELNKNGIYSFS